MTKPIVAMIVSFTSPNSGIKSELPEMFYRDGEVDLFFARLSKFHYVESSRVVFRKPKSAEHFSAYI